MKIKKDNGTLSKDLFKFLKYNIIGEGNILSEYDEEYYKEFLIKINTFEKALEKNDDSLAQNILGSLMNMFGYSRHYCSISGQPIIGKYFKINGKPVSKDAYDSYKLIQQMEKFNKKEENPKKEVKLDVKKHG